MNALDISEYVIAYNDEYGDLITNKKLQKLLYYIAAWGLVYFEDGIIDDDFVAWVHGPVCIASYNKYKPFGYSPLKIDYKDSASSFIKHWEKEHHNIIDFKGKKELIDTVLQKYIPFSSMQLELLTHSEEPWKEARKGLSPVEKGTKIISKDTMLRFYKNMIDANN